MQPTQPPAPGWWMASDGQWYPPQSNAKPLASEQVIVEAPMSFTGATKRIWRLTHNSLHAAVQWGLVVPGVVLLLLFAWTFIAGWYVLWGLWLVPYRLVRRGGRNRRRDEMRHREMLAAVQQAPTHQQHTSGAPTAF